MKEAKERKIVSPAKAVILGLGVIVASGTIYFASKQLRKKRSENDITPDALEVNTYTSSYHATTPKLLPAGNDNFPLQQGSRGERVKKLQLALRNILGSTAMDKLTAIDGIFGKGTVKALKAASLPVVIDETTFNRLTGSVTVTNVLPVNTPSKLALSLYRYVREKMFDGVLEVLRIIQNTNEYDTLNKHFIAQQLFSVSKSIVTYLLETFTDETQREQIISEFKRIGLKLNEDTGKWSLSGFGRPYNDIKTLRTTYVVDQYGNYFKIKPNTILGEETTIQNGMTHFKSVDGMLYKVPTQDVKYNK
jgi:peptidoglycan hydrolase-like protein with peptidoglycan-binding domain